MKTKAEILLLLSHFKDQNANRFGLLRIGIFGSVAREEQTDMSDVDICVETSNPSLFNLVHLKDELQQLFHCPVDLIRLRDCMDDLLRVQIEKEGVYV